MDVTKLRLSLILAPLLATAGYSDSPKPEGMLYGADYIPVEIRADKPPLRLKNLELPGEREE